MRTHPRRRGATAALLAVLAVAPALAGCTGDDATGNANFVAGDGTITVLDPSRRAQPIALAGTTLEGKRFDLASLRGRTVVLNVWGSWCPPCRKEAPDLQASLQVLEPRGVAFIGLNVREPDPAQALAYQRTFGITYPSLSDDSGSLQLALRGAVAANAIPSTLVLDGEGRIAARISGATTKLTLVGVVDSVLNGTPPAARPPATSSPAPSPAPSATSSSAPSPASSGTP
jgi:thiol-disulfide isomerase/thioredoxin